jgi:hypothetical protein
LRVTIGGPGSATDKPACGTGTLRLETIDAVPFVVNNLLVGKLGALATDAALAVSAGNTTTSTTWDGIGESFGLEAVRSPLWRVMSAAIGNALSTARAFILECKASCFSSQTWTNFLSQFQSLDVLFMPTQDRCEPRKKFEYIKLVV